MRPPTSCPTANIVGAVAVVLGGSPLAAMLPHAARGNTGALAAAPAAPFTAPPSEPGTPPSTPEAAPLPSSCELHPAHTTPARNTTNAFVIVAAHSSTNRSPAG